MGRARAQNKYIHDFAATIAGQLGVSSRIRFSYQPASTKFGGQLLFGFGGEVAAKLQAYSPETLGKIAACGLGSASGAQFALCHVRESGDRINWSHSGQELLVMLATTAVIAAMADNIRAQHQRTPLARSSGVNVGLGKPDFVPGSVGQQIIGPTLDQTESRRDPAHYEGRYGKFEEE